MNYFEEIVINQLGVIVEVSKNRIPINRKKISINLFIITEVIPTY